MAALELPAFGRLGESFTVKVLTVPYGLVTLEVGGETMATNADESGVAIFQPVPQLPGVVAVSVSDGADQETGVVQVLG